MGIRKRRSPQMIDFAKNGVYCNDLMLKTVFIVMVSKINSMKKILLANFGELKYGVYQGYGILTSIASAQIQL